MTDAEILRAVRAALQTGFHTCFERGRREFRRRTVPLSVLPPPRTPPLPEGLGQAPEVARRLDAAAPAALSPRDWAEIGEQVLTLHEGYTRGGTEFAQAGNPIHDNLPGYQFYFLPRNFHRVYGVLKALPWGRGQQAELLEPWLGGAGGRAALRVLDVGCGSGAFSLAVLAWLARTAADPRRMPAVELVLVDQSRALLELAQANVQALWRQLAPDAALSVQVVAGGVEQYLGGQHSGGLFAIAGAAMMLNELNVRAPRRSGKRASRFVEPFKRLLAPQGLGLLVEPGTRKGYLNLMLVREQIEGLPILYPCPHAGPCPMWSPKVNRWCHATLSIQGDFFFDVSLKRHGGLTFAMHDVNVFALAFQQSSRVATRAVRPRRGRQENGAPAAGPRAQPPFEQLSGERVVSGLIPGPKLKAKRTMQAGSAARPSTVPPPAPRTVLLCTRGGTLLELPVSGELAARHPYRGQWLEGLPLPIAELGPPRTATTKRKLGSRAPSPGNGRIKGNAGNKIKDSGKGGAQGNAGARSKQDPSAKHRSTGRAKRRG